MRTISVDEARATTFLPPYAPATRPWYLDIFWQHFRGRPFATSGSDGYTATQQDTWDAPIYSTAEVAAGAITLPVTAGKGAKFVVGEPIIVGSGTTWTTFTIHAIAGDSLTILPPAMVAIPAGVEVNHAWSNTTHPRDYRGLAQTISDSRQAPFTPGPNLFAYGSFASTHTDSNGKTAVPVGWQSGNGPGTSGSGTWGAPAAGLSFLAAAWSNLSAHPLARGGFACHITPTVVGDGIRTVDAIPVTPGTTYTLAYQMGAGVSFNVTVVDKNAPTVILGTKVGGNTLSGGYINLGVAMAVTFTAPAGVTSIEIRITSNGTTSNGYFDDFRLIASRQDADYNRYVIEDPGEAQIVLVGDSWGESMGPFLKTALEARIGRTINLTNLSVGGERLDGTNAKFTTEVKPRNPRYCIVQTFTNDISAGYTIAATKTNLDTFIENCRSNGIIPVITGIGALSTATVALTKSRDWNDDLRARVDRFAM